MFSTIRVPAAGMKYSCPRNLADGSGAEEVSPGSEQLSHAVVSTSKPDSAPCGQRTALPFLGPSRHFLVVGMGQGHVYRCLLLLQCHGTGQRGLVFVCLLAFLKLLSFGLYRGEVCVQPVLTAPLEAHVDAFS